MSAIVSAARSLTFSTRFNEALELLDVAAATEAVRGTQRGGVRLALAAAETAIHADYVRGSQLAAARLAALDELTLAEEFDTNTSFDVALARWRHQYAQQMRGPDGSSWFGPQGRDPQVVSQLAVGAEGLRSSAPDAVRRGWGSMACGWLSDNVLGERDRAPEHYESALAAGRASGDDYLVFEAQRHLGDHAYDDGDHDAALLRWREAAEAAARRGHVSGVLAQHLLLAVLARDAGDDAGARALALETARWAGAVGARTVAAQATRVLHGQEPTPGPVEIRCAGSPGAGASR